MLIRKGYKFRLKLSEGEDRKLKIFSGCCRFVWNKALAVQDGLFRDEDQNLLSKTKLLNLLSDWKQEHPFLKESYSQILQQSLIDLDRAYQGFFRRLRKIRAGDFSEGDDPGYPKFKKKYLHDSFRFPQGFRIENRHIYLPKLGWFRFYKSQEIEGTPKNVTVSRDGPHWYVSVQVEQKIPDPCSVREPSTGLDMGVSRFVTLSNGSFMEPLNVFRGLESKLAREQKKLSRKVKFSSNWKKQKAKVQKIHRKIRDTRLDFLHKISRWIADKYNTVFVEDLRIGNMSASAKGTVDNPGTNVKAKSGLNKSILDQGWGEFLRQLGYKLMWKGGELLRVNPANTSVTCSRCGHVSSDNRKSQSRFECEVCALEINADHNAAINIKTLGQRGLVCGSNRTSGRKQKLPGNGDRVPVPA